MIKQKNPMGPIFEMKKTISLVLFEIFQTHRTGCGNSNLHSRELEIPDRWNHRTWLHWSKPQPYLLCSRLPYKHIQDCHLFLPVASIGEMPSSKRAKLPSWLLARKIRITLQADTKMVSLSQFALWTYLNLVQSSSEDSPASLNYRQANSSAFNITSI